MSHVADDVMAVTARYQQHTRRRLSDKIPISPSIKPATRPDLEVAERLLSIQRDTERPRVQENVVAAPRAALAASPSQQGSVGPFAAKSDGKVDYSYRTRKKCAQARHRRAFRGGTWASAVEPLPLAPARLAATRLLVNSYL